MKPERGQRKQQILECLAIMLQEQSGARITTAKLAEAVGVSEAALYRHFPSKAKMFEALLEFMEEALFSRINVIAGETDSLKDKVNKVAMLWLTFAKRNPGLSCLMNGEALVGENPRTQQRARGLTDRLETELRSLIRNAEIQNQVSLKVSSTIAAQLLVSVIEGTLQRFVRTQFKYDPTSAWPVQWDIVWQGIARSE
ncbi:nucleoid occlusion factor SlmA [Hahella sp. CCB-MM4]|uniref:nucleoid occlusion factor SlmA n=1 Tax=Hahella sp. (strain CCB-MM4) TaxID=1926491 RepID=UPI000B9A2C30|nr:nucleoid occlusion factor SlmA [Hahella sp. CCB-MM4]OZG71371.1 nucleoid occlusion factor SlmA [Hahella sp. CCB-MM4]